MSRRLKVNRPRVSGPAARSGPISGDSGKGFQADRQPHRWQSFAICVFLAAAIWAVFGQTLHHEFVNYDDNIYVYENPSVSHGLHWSAVVWAFTHFNYAEWWPLSCISHMLDCQVYGLNAGGHHLTNVLLHAATAIVLFLVLRELTGAFWRSAFVAAVFAVHPLRVESVAWVTERKDVLSGLFFVLTIGAYVRFVRKPFKLGRYLLVLALFTLGLLSKAIVVTLPFVLLLLDYWPLERWRPGLKTPPEPNRLKHETSKTSATLGQLIIEKIPMLLLAGAGCAATFLATRNAESILAAHGLAFPDRISNAFVAYVDYIGHMLYPVGLAVWYPNPVISLTFWRVAWSVTVLLLISVAVVILRKRCPPLLVGWLWYLGMLVPVIDTMQAGHQARADRYTYLPQIGLCILATWGVMELFGGWRFKKAALGAAAAAILASLMAIAHVQTSYWRDSVSLWTHCLTCTPENYVIHNTLGVELAAQGKFAQAIEQYDRSIQLEPDYAKAHYNLGLALAAQGKAAQAVEHFERALQLKPDYSEAHMSLGLALASQGQFPQAVEHYERAIQLKPDYSEAHMSLGLALARQGNYTEAIEHYERALQLKPDYSVARNNLGIALASQGKWDEAVQEFERALQLKPDFLEAQNNLRRALASQGKVEKPSPITN